MNIALPFVSPDFRFKLINEQQYIYDAFRKKFVILNPEEWVRQNVLSTLVRIYNFPIGLISVEKELKINVLKKRFDAVVYSRERKPWMLIECKAPHIMLTEAVLDQTLHYYQKIQCPYIMIVNGESCYIAAISSTSFKWLDAVPIYNL